MNTHAFRFTELRLSKGLTQEQMADILEISGSLISRIEKGQSPISDKVWFKLFEKFQISRNWGIESDNTTEEPNQKMISNTTTPTGNPIPYYSVDVTAGNVTLFDDTHAEIPSAYYYLPAFQDCVAVSVKGESMLGRYNPGDIIFIKEVHYWKGSGILDFGNVYLIFTRDGLRVIKKVRKADEKRYWRLCSENPEFDDFEIEVDSVLRVFEVKGKLQQNAF